ncbi:hypothetical protein NAC44_10565 [Allorhizobium sp. BGMRC 0089]|uniref:hypothetical protein n=1 Tax=Allorhizobium sonneratiae TaxID=2934936 RepID=UPI0020335CF7|nr:hypothetical protein [Allorhizobium sonneratiae]MCM2292765.1 hypothetical protein [Allorhizobium sonneratiae]
MVEARKGVDPALIVFIHIMKAAGSSVNRFLQYCSPKGEVWLHNFLSSPNTLRDVAHQSDWISGHFRRDEIEPIIKGIGRSVEFYSSVRNPARRILSHINYSVERYRRPDYYKLHSKREQMMDFSIMSKNLNNKYNIFEIILENEEEFCNMQAKMLLGGNFKEMTNENAREIISSYKFISTESNIEELYYNFGFLCEDNDETAVFFENKSTQHINPELAEDEEVIAFCNEHCGYDYVVYEMVKEIFGTSAPQERCRPSFTRHVLATVENFDEDAYLLANPDVSQAVAEKAISSGFDHFLNYGRDEGRMQLTWTQVKSDISVQ